jgi:hypothetical protein
MLCVAPDATTGAAGLTFVSAAGHVRRLRLTKTSWQGGFLPFFCPSPPAALFQHTGSGAAQRAKRAVGNQP